MTIFNRKSLIKLKKLSVLLLKLRKKYQKIIENEKKKNYTPPTPKQSKKKPTFFEAIFLQVINPKAYLVNGILFTGFPLQGFNLQQEILIKTLIINFVWVPVHFIWLWLGVKLRQWGLSKGRQSAVNKSMAFCLFIVILLAGLSEF